MPVKFFYIFDKVENTSIASHRGLPTVTQWTHLIKKISLGVYIYIYIYLYLYICMLTSFSSLSTLAWLR